MTFLVQDELNLFLKGHAAEQGIQCLAASHAVIVSITAAVRARDEMLDARLALQEWLPAEEAQAALGKHQSIEWLRRHSRLTFAVL